MAEFLQNYWIWILLIGGMFLMHRLGIGCCGGHRHDQGHGPGETPKAEPAPTDAKPAVRGEPEPEAPARPPRGSGCH